MSTLPGIPGLLPGSSWTPRSLPGLVWWTRASRDCNLAIDGVSIDSFANFITPAQTATPDYAAHATLDAANKRAVFGTGPTCTSYTINTSILTGATAAELFIVAQPTAGTGYAYSIGGRTAGGSAIPYIPDSLVYDSFGSTVRKDGIYSLTAQKLLHNAYSSDGDWGCYDNGTLKYSTASNTYAMTCIRIGTNNSQPTTEYLIGYIYEWLLYSRKLTPTERTHVTAYLRALYGL